MLIIILVVVALSILILTHEAGHFFAAKAFGLKVEEFGFGLPPEMVGISARKVWSFRRGEVLYSINWIPFGGFVKLAGEADGMQEATGLPAEPSDEEKKHLFRFQPWWKRGSVLAAGVVVNFITGWFLVSTVLAVGAPPALVVSGTQPNSPAAAAGIEAGDLIQNYTQAKDFIDFVGSHRGEKITVKVLRGKNELSFDVVPRVTTGPGEGPIGVGLAQGGAPSEPVWQALYEGLIISIRTAGLVIVSFYGLVKNLILHGTLLEGIVGPVGIVSLASETSRIGFIYLVNMLSQIAISLAVVNFMPFPALDGGQFLLVIIEKIKGSPLLSRKVEALVNVAGFFFLIALIVLISIRDIRSF